MCRMCKNVQKVQECDGMLGFIGDLPGVRGSLFPDFLPVLVRKVVNSCSGMWANPSKTSRVVRIPLSGVIFLFPV